MENGSGGFLGDLYFIGGKFGFVLYSLRIIILFSARGVMG